jgi:hypothetical protein
LAPTEKPITTYTVNGVELTFTSATLSNKEVQMGNETLTPNPGYSVLVVTGAYKGDLTTLFGSNGVFQAMGVFYVLEKDGTIDEWVYEYRTWTSVETQGIVQIAFFVKTGFNPYTLVNTIETQFQIDLSTLLGNL